VNPKTFNLEKESPMLRQRGGQRIVAGCAHGSSRRRYKLKGECEAQGQTGNWSKREKREWLTTRIRQRGGGGGEAEDKKDHSTHPKGPYFSLAARKEQRSNCSPFATRFERWLVGVRGNEGRVSLFTCKQEGPFSFPGRRGGKMDQRRRP